MPNASSSIRMPGNRRFSTPWKILPPFFHTMENSGVFFPHYGKKFSTPWKTAD